MILGMGERGLTPRQRRFAELLASGSSKVDSFRAAYPSDKPSKNTEWQSSKRVSRLPQVRAEVERLTLLRSPHDAGAQTEHIQARLIELTKNADPAIALRAIAQWGKLAQAGLLKPPPSAAKQGNVAAGHGERARIVEQLKTLYEKALGPSWQQRNELVVATKANSIEEVDCQIVSDCAPGELPAISMVDEPVETELEPATDQDAQGESPPPEAPEETALETEAYEWRPRPGDFGRARRIRVQIR
jgi:hypothetical protein